MKGETRRIGSAYGTCTMAKREIGGNTYLIIVKPLGDEADHTHRIDVWADDVSGEDHGFPPEIQSYEMRKTKYEKLVSGYVSPGQEVAAVTAGVLNKAIGSLTDTLEETKSQEDAVLGALEANAEIHDG